MIGATSLIEENIPIRPRHRSIIEIIYHRIPITLAQCPVVYQLKVELLFTSFREDQILVREGLSYFSDIGKLHITTGPGLVPVKANPPYEFRCIWIIED